MLFLLAILGYIASTGILDYLWKKFFKKDKDLPTTKSNKKKKSTKKNLITPKQINKLSQKDITKLSKKITLKDIVEIYSKINEQQKDQLRRAIYKGVASSNWKLREEYEQFMKSIRVALRKKARNQAMTYNQVKLVEIARDLLINKNQTNKYIPGRSSWIIAIKYTPSSKLMWVKMVRGKVIYKFPNVGDIDYLALITCAGTQGTFWWKEWYWRFSINASRWNRKRR